MTTPAHTLGAADTVEHIGDPRAYSRGTPVWQRDVLLYSLVRL